MSRSSVLCFLATVTLVSFNVQSMDFMMVRNAVRSSTFTLNLRGGRAAMTGSAADSFTEKDQHDLNRYVGIRERRKEMKVEIKQLQEEMDGLQEAKDEVETMDEETAKDKFKLNYPPALGFRWAETFTTWEPSAISQFLDYKLRLLEGQGKDMENDLQEMTENMIELHQRLTDRFGDALALEPLSEECEETAASAT